MKNKRIIYWGGNENTIIPRMGACGEGVDVDPASGAGGGGAQSPAASASAPDAPSLFDKLKGLLPALALGALVLGAIAGVAFMLKKKRDVGGGAESGLGGGPDRGAASRLGGGAGSGLGGGAGSGLGGGAPNGSPTGNPPPVTPSPFTDASGKTWKWNPDPPPGKWELDGALPDWDDDKSDEENYSALGLDVQGATTENISTNFDGNGNPNDGFNENGLPIPPDFIGQQITDEDGNLWVYKDPPGAWINFGDTEAQYTTSGDGQSPIFESYFSKIVGVTNSKELILEDSWQGQGQKVGNLSNYESSYPAWNIIYHQNPNDLYTYLQFDNDKTNLVVNFKKDDVKYQEYPYSVVYKLYEPLPPGISEGDLTYVVKEMIPPL